MIEAYMADLSTGDSFHEDRRTFESPRLRQVDTAIRELKKQQAFLLGWGTFPENDHLSGINLARDYNRILSSLIDQVGSLDIDSYHVTGLQHELRKQYLDFDGDQGRVALREKNGAYRG